MNAGSCLAGFSHVVRSIESLQRACAARTDVIALAGGLPDPALFPRDAMRSALTTVMAEPKLAALQYGWPEGDEKLRRWIAQRVRVAAEDVIVTAGAQQAIAIAAAMIPRGRTIGVAPATYPGALELFATHGLVPSEGPNADAFYLVPEIGNPEGLPLDPRLAEIVRASDVPVIADEAYAELRFDGRPTTRVADRFSPVWRVGTFAKTLCPGLRVGWLVPPPPHRARALRLKHDADLQASGLGQAVLAELLRTWDYDAHLDRARHVYARRAEALVAALRRRLPSWTFSEPEGGFSLFANTNLPGDDVAFLAVASAHGVSFDPGRMFRISRRATIELRLCHCNVAEPLLEEGVRRLARAWSVFTSRSSGAQRPDRGPA
jgi:2-aminoadipate transaminase